MARKKQAESGCMNIIFLVAMGLIILAFVSRLARAPGDWEVDSNRSREDFISDLAPLAQELGEAYGLFPSVVLAQAALESGFGQSLLTQEYKNYFGIKAQAGEGVLLPTQEVEEGQFVDEDAYFRSYRSARQSFYDYGDLISQAPRYEPVRQATSPEEACLALYPAGYSTNPAYGDLLIQLINDYDLKRFDP